MRRHLLLAGGVALVTAIAGVAVAASASAGTTTYEAEAGGNRFGGGARVVPCDRCSGGKRVTGIGRQGTLTFVGVLAERAGPTRITVTYASEVARVAQVSVNKSAGVGVAFPATRAANRTGTLRITVTLVKGPNTVGFANPAGPAPDVDRLVVTTDGTPPLPVAGVPATSSQPADGPSPGADGGTASPPPTPGSSPGADEPAVAEVVRLVNAVRQPQGCKPVTVDAHLTAAARDHATDMAARGYFDHTGLNGVTFGVRLTKAGYHWRTAGENIAKGQQSATEVMASWMNSAGHRANILNCGFRNIGVGVASDADGTLLWTQDFAA